LILGTALARAEKADHLIDAFVRFDSAHDNQRIRLLSFAEGVKSPLLMSWEALESAVAERSSMMRREIDTLLTATMACA